MLFNWKSKILSPIVAVAMLFTMCPSTTFAAKTYLHEVLEDKDSAPLLEELKRIVSKHPEWLNEKDDDGHIPLDIAKANGLSEIVSFLTSQDCRFATLETQIEELKRKQLKEETRAKDEEKTVRTMTEAALKTQAEKMTVVT